MFSYLPDFLPSSIILIGAGGTGSRLMPMMSQLVRTCLRHYNANAWLEKLPIFVIDGDVVEEKNLLRQNFINKDVGKPKSSTVASRYSTAFGIDIFPSIEFIKDDESEINILGMSDSLNRFSFNNSVVIMAVDSAEARRLILRKIMNGNCQSVQHPSRCFVIDAGNEDAFGQVKFFTLNPIIMEGTSFPYQMPNQFPEEFKVNFIPFDADYYTNLGSSTQELSCADLPQTLAINAMMATLICTVLQNFLYLKPMTFDGIRFSMNGSMTTEHNTPKRWLQRVDDYSLSKARKLKIKTSGGYYFNYSNIEVTRKDSPFVRIQIEAEAFYKKAGLIINSKGDLERDPAVVARELEQARLAAEKEAMRVKKEQEEEETRLRAKTDEVLSELSVTGVPVLTRVEDGVEVVTPTSIPALVPVRAPRNRGPSRRAPAAPTPVSGLEVISPVIANPASVVTINTIA